MEDSLFGGTLGDAQGVSQGQGRGLAQVFDSTYSTAFKDAAALELKSDKEDKKLLNSRLVKLAENKVWDRDQPLLQEKLNDINAYAQQNYRQIGKGNTPEAFELNKKISDVTQFAYASLKTEKEWAARALEVEKKTGNYDYEESDNRLKQMLLSPGNMDVSQMSLVPEFNTTNFEKSLSGNIQRMLLKDPEVSIPSGKDIHGNAIYKINQDVAKEKLDLMAENSWNDLQPYQQKKYNNDFDAFKQMVYNYAPSKDRVVIQGESSQSNSGKPEQNIQYKVEDVSVINTDQPVSLNQEGKKAFTRLNSYAMQSAKFTPGQKEKLVPRQLKDMGAKVYSQGNFALVDYSESGDYTGKKPSGYYTENTVFDLSGTAVDFEVQAVQKLPVFKVKEIDVNGKKIDVSNIILSKKDIDNGTFRGVKLTDELVEFQPYVVGIYDQVLDEDVQKNYEVAVPYTEFRNLLTTKNTSKKELGIFEEQVTDSGLLNTSSYTEFQEKKKGKKQATTQSTEKKEAKKLTMETFKDKYPNSYNVLSKVKDEYVKKYEKYVSQIDEDKTPLSPEAFLKKLNLTESQYKK